MGLLSTTESASAGSLSLFDPSSIAQTPQYQSHTLQLLLANDAFSLKGLFHNFDGAFHSQSDPYRLIGDIRYDFGVTVMEGLYVGYTYRKEAVIESSPDTMKLIHQVSQKLDLPVGKSYRVQLQIEGFETHGVVLAKRLPLSLSRDWEVTLGIGTELLYGIQTQDGTAKGRAEALSQNAYDFRWHSDYRYVTNYLYDLDVESTTAWGYTTHLSLQLAYQHFHVEMIVNDMVGKLYWKALPYSRVDLSSANKLYDKEGYVHYRPIASGYEGTQRFTQTLMRKWRLQGGYYGESDGVTIGVDTIKGHSLSFIDFSHRYSDMMVVALGYVGYFNMVGMRIEYGENTFSIDTNGIKEPTAMKIGFGWQYRF